MDVTLLYFNDCPNWKVTSEHLDTLADEIPGLRVRRQVVTTMEDAQALQFRGSPSVIVNGVDAFAEPGDPAGLSCRMYQTPDGLAGTPTLRQLREVLLATN